jgi:fatty acid hydroxylase family protein
MAAMAIDYYVEFITVPLTALLLGVLSPFNIVGFNELIAGYLLWVFIEWWMHAVLFHRTHRRRHWIHHLRPFDQAGSPGTWTVAHPTLLGIALAGWFTNTPALACGLVLGYGSYIFTHHAIHARWLPEHSSVRQRHELHHRGVEKNFNLLNPLGDLIMGTYVRPSRGA